MGKEEDHPANNRAEEEPEDQALQPAPTRLSDCLDAGDAVVERMTVKPPIVYRRHDWP